MTLTPEQFNKLATKEDLKEFVKKEEFEEAKNEILGAVDAVMHKLDDIEHAFVSNQAAHDRFESRLERIEKQLGLKPMFN
jgi:hypothetical protein